MRLFTKFKVGVTGLAIVLLMSCSSNESKVGKFFNLDTDVELSFKVGADINPDDSKTPSPLFIRMYELKSATAFQKASFIDLFERDKDTLGPDLLSKQRLKRIKPGEDYQVKFVLSDKTQYVGLFAEFLEYKNATFRVVIPVVSHNVLETSGQIRVSGNTISIIK